LVQQHKEKWTSLAYEAAFFDQAHFIKDFKHFTGENPGKYSFDEKNMANFFLMPHSKNVF
jgi:AraC-like DNA-binding protein